MLDVRARSTNAMQTPTTGAACRVPPAPPAAQCPRKTYFVQKIEIWSDDLLYCSKLYTIFILFDIFLTSEGVHCTLSPILHRKNGQIIFHMDPTVSTVNSVKHSCRALDFRAFVMREVYIA